MRRGRGLSGMLASALLALCITAPPAAGAPPSAPQLYAGLARLNDSLALMGQGTSGAGLPFEQRFPELRFENSDGYAITVVGFGQTVALNVSRAKLRPRRSGDGARKPRDRVSTTTYLVHGKVTPSSIDASFGDRGRISVRFLPSGRRVHASRKAGCKTPGDDVIANLGVFVGALSFEGEGGYTSVDVHRVPGRSVKIAALFRCLFASSPGARKALPSPRAPFGIDLPGAAMGHGKQPSSPFVPTHPSTGPRTTTLVADSKDGLARTVLAAQVRGRARPRFLAAEEVSEGSIGVLRLVYARGPAGAFSFDDALSAADVSPPPPFSGHAELRRGPGNAKSWSGSLSASFLGAAAVPLTGPLFGAWLSRGF